VIARPVVSRELANRDVDEAIAHDLKEAGDRVALGFIAALERAFRHVSRHPASGSLGYAVELNLPGLRAWPLRRFPHLVFYVETEDRIDVWRVLHSARGIPAWMQETDSR
jgi:toxin ParE1/3/4